MTGNGSGGSVIETHVSLLVFLDDVVLKYKKPLCLPFVDFTSRVERLVACQHEVEYNRRLSPDVYLGVADVRLGSATFDHAVVMRRLPKERSLARMVESGGVLPRAHLARLARLLAGFHAKAERSPEIDDDGLVRSIARTWRLCLDSLSPFAELLGAADLAHIEELATAYLDGREALFEERIAGRHVCDGHGDLLADDVFVLDDGPRVLDCVEFDSRLRHVDVVADIAFLVMDLERLGAPQAARDFVHLYREAAADSFPESLLDHYCAQRAVIRSEVACLRHAQTAGGQDTAVSAPGSHAAQANALLALALEHLRAARVVLAVVGGLPGTGKSTLAMQAGDTLQWPVLRSDEIRAELVGSPRHARLVGPVGAGPYSAETTERTYSIMLERARVALERGQSVILDATFTDRAFQVRAEELAHRTVSELAVVECTAPTPVAVARIRARAARGEDPSGADENVARALASRAAHWPIAVRVDTSDRLVAECLDDVLGVLRDKAPHAADGSLEHWGAAHGSLRHCDVEVTGGHGGPAWRRQHG